MEHSSDYQPLADIEIDEVRPDSRGFALTGRGADGGDYRLGIHFGMPLDSRTRAVLGELLSQSEVLVARRASALAGGPARRNRVHQ